MVMIVDMMDVDVEVYVDVDVDVDVVVVMGCFGYGVLLHSVAGTVSELGGTAWFTSFKWWTKEDGTIYYAMLCYAILCYSMRC